MSDIPRLGDVGRLPVMLALIAIACGSDVVELLPALAGAGNGAGAGNAATSGGASSAGVLNEAGSSAMNPAGGSGSVASSSRGGNAGSGDCSGFSCGDAGEGPNFGGTFGGPICNGMSSCTPCLSDFQCLPDQHCSRFLNNICVQCNDNSQCKTGYSCDRWVGRCGQSCKSTLECNDGRVCDMAQGTCVPCIDNRQCESDGDPNTHVCSGRRCVECEEDSDCLQGDRHRCANLQCVECINDNDCPGSNRNDYGHCDTVHARCEWP